MEDADHALTLLRHMATQAYLGVAVRRVQDAVDAERWSWYMVALSVASMLCMRHRDM